MNHLRINYIECIKTGRNDNKLTTVSYQVSYQHIGNYEVILSKYLYACNKVFSLNNLVCKRRPFQIFCQRWGLFKEKTNGKSWEFVLSKKGEEKTPMAKVVKSCPQVTWAQKSVTRKRVNFLFQNL